MAAPLLVLVLDEAPWPCDEDVVPDVVAAPPVPRPCDVRDVPDGEPAGAPSVELVVPVSSPEVADGALVPAVEVGPVPGPVVLRPVPGEGASVTVLPVVDVEVTPPPRLVDVGGGWGGAAVVVDVGRLGPPVPEGVVDGRPVGEAVVVVEGSGALVRGALVVARELVGTFVGSCVPGACVPGAVVEVAAPEAPVLDGEPLVLLVLPGVEAGGVGVVGEVPAAWATATGAADNAAAANARVRPRPGRPVR